MVHHLSIPYNNTSIFKAIFFCSLKSLPTKRNSPIGVCTANADTFSEEHLTDISVFAHPQKSQKRTAPEINKSPFYLFFSEARAKAPLDD